MELTMKKILLSIRPFFVEKILNGSKTVEYRKRIPKDASIRQVLVYSSYPVRKVVAEFTVGGYLTGTPDKLWSKTCLIGGIDYVTFKKYFSDKSIGYAYQIKDVKLFPRERTLFEYGLDYAPQDFCYVEDNCSSLVL